MRRVREVELLQIVDAAPHVVMNWFQSPALVTRQPPQPLVGEECFLINHLQQLKTKINLLQVLGSFECILSHIEESLADVQLPQRLHPGETVAVQLECEGQTQVERPTLFRQIQLLDAGSSDGWRNRPQLIL